MCVVYVSIYVCVCRQCTCVCVRTAQASLILCIFFYMGMCPSVHNICLFLIKMFFCKSIDRSLDSPVFARTSTYSLFPSKQAGGKKGLRVLSIHALL